MSRRALPAPAALLAVAALVANPAVGRAVAHPGPVRPAVEPVTTSATQATAIPGTHVTLPGGRTYWLCGATGGGTARALIIGLTFSGHGAAFLNDAAWVTSSAATTGWCRHAASTGYTLLLGDPVRGAWNVGTGVADPNPNGWPGSGQDDEGYLLGAVADAGQRTPIDPDRVYAAGGSAGAAMAWRVTADHPEVFKGCAIVAGWVPYRYPAQPIDCRMDNGTADITVPIRGGRGTAGYLFPPAYDAMARAPRGSRVALYATGGGHGIPGWWAAAVWRFVSDETRRP